MTTFSNYSRQLLAGFGALAISALLFANTATLDLLDLATGGLDETTDAHSPH